MAKKKDWREKYRSDRNKDGSIRRGPRPKRDEKNWKKEYDKLVRNVRLDVEMEKRLEETRRKVADVPIPDSIKKRMYDPYKNLGKSKKK